MSSLRSTAHGPHLPVLAMVDDPVAEGGPEGQGLRVVVEDGEAHGGAARCAEAVLHEGGQTAAVALAVQARVHQQKADPGVRVGGVGMMGEGDRDPGQVAETAGEQDLGAGPAPFLRQGVCHLLRGMSCGSGKSPVRVWKAWLEA